MHGRIKVKTTAEQKEEKRKERKKKLKVFQSALAIIFKKISVCQYDDEGMNVTMQLLTANSDFASLWNYRKSALKYFKSTKSSTQCDTLFNEELALTETCLRKNPKSYSCWHQRCFVMLEMDEPNWDKELHLTELFLQLDDRNFHCWDYRRFLIKKCGHSINFEIDLTSTLIENNFSNYSSWHYRSKLLPTLYSNKIPESDLIKELNLVQNAFFTDPNDQSAWFYHKWLLGRCDIKQDFLSILVKKSPITIICTLRKAVTVNFFDKISVTTDEDDQLNGRWTGLSNQKFARCWLFISFNKKYCRSVTLEHTDNKFTACCRISSFEKENLYVKNMDVKMFHNYVSDEILLHMKTELDSCQELNELEPGNKWVLLTLVLLKKIIDPINYNMEIFDHLAYLCKIDKQRLSYYEDLKSQYEIESLICSCPLENRIADFSKHNLTRLCHTEFLTFVVHLDISNNQLTCLGENFSILYSLQILKANKNKIQTISGLHHLTNLKELDLRSNDICSRKVLISLTTCNALSFVYLTDNPFLEVDVSDNVINFNFKSDTAL